MTRKPMRSARSRNSGAGGLWDVRRAFTPMLFSCCRRFSMARVFTAAPSVFWSWWLQVLFNFMAAPFSVNLLVALKANVRMPNGVVYVSTTPPPAEMVVTAEYIDGEATDHSLGLDTITVWVTVTDLHAAT